MSCNNCRCNDTPCQPASVDCTCAVRLNSDCITVSGATTECSSIDNNLPLTEFLSLQDAYICEKFESISGFTSLRNVGVGADVYKGVDGIGRKEIRRIKSTNNSVTITQGTDDINLSVAIPTGAETKIVSGSNATVTGEGTVGSPYVVNNTAPDQTVTLTQGGATTITGTYPNFTISSVNTVADGSETKVQAGINTTVTGTGTVSSPYIVTSTARPYKVYTALLTQSGTNTPTAVVIENSLGGTVVWTRVAAGIYAATLAGVFTNNKTVCFMQSNGQISIKNIGRTDDDSVFVQSVGAATAITGDNFIVNDSVEIRVYN